jgi:MFS family permease
MNTTANRGKINLILSTCAFAISSSGSVLLNIVFATTVYRNTGSGLLTSLFLALQWLPVLTVILYKSDWEDGVDPRKRWIRLDILAAILTCPVLFFVESPNYPMLFLLLFGRGIVDHINRIIKTVASRYIFPKEKGALYASILQTSYHFGIGLAAIVGVTIGNKFSLKIVTLFDIATYLIAALLMSFVKTINDVDDQKKAPVGSLKQRLAGFTSAVGSDPRLFFSAILPPLTSTFFQGTYTVFQPIFPVKVLQLGREAVTVSYVLASVAILGGSSLFAYLSKRFKFFSINYSITKTIVFVLSGICAGSYLVSVATSNYLVSAIFFSLMILTFEMIYMFGYAGIVAYAPKGELGSVFGIIFCIGCSLASLCVVATGAILDFFGNDFFSVVVFFMSIYLFLLGVGYLIYRKMLQLQPESEIRSGLVDCK